MLFDSNSKPELQYPCPWEYKVIGESESAMRRAIAEIFMELDHAVAFSHSSRTGKYCSLLVGITVADEEQRLSLFASLKAHRDIKIVL